MNRIKQYAKAIAAFIGGVVLNSVVQLAEGQVPWPQTGAEWLRFALTSLGVAVTVAAAPANKVTQKQLDEDPSVVGGVVVSAPRRGRYSNPWR